MGEENFEILNQQAELNVQKYFEKTENELQETFDNAVQGISGEVNDVLQSHLTQTFCTHLENTLSLAQKNMNERINVQQIQNQFKSNHYD